MAKPFGRSFWKLNYRLSFFDVSGTAAAATAAATTVQNPSFSLSFDTISFANLVFMLPPSKGVHTHTRTVWKKHTWSIWKYPIYAYLRWDDLPLPCLFLLFFFPHENNIILLIRRKTQGRLACFRFHFHATKELCNTTQLDAKIEWSRAVSSPFRLRRRPSSSRPKTNACTRKTSRDGQSHYIVLNKVMFSERQLKRKCS